VIVVMLCRICEDPGVIDVGLLRSRIGVYDFLDLLLAQGTGHSTATPCVAAKKRGVNESKRRLTDHRRSKNRSIKNQQTELSGETKVRATTQKHEAPQADGVGSLGEH
jgi:hypothetical protein